jgi:hypothetical protein
MSDIRTKASRRRYGCMAKLILLFFVVCLVFVTLFGVGLINCGGSTPTKG